MAFALVRALLMIMRFELREGMSQGLFSKQDQPCETLLLDGPDSPIRIGVQIRAPDRQLLGAIKLLGDQLPMPGEDRAGFSDGCDLLQHVLPELLAHRSQRLSITITKPQTAPDLLTERSIFGNEVLITRQQLLVH
jgi:hypothetical protein